MAELFVGNKAWSPELKLGVGAGPTRPHAHNGFSISGVVAGTTTIAIGPYLRTLIAGDYVCIPAGIVHLCSVDGRERFEYASFYLPIAARLSLGDWCKQIRFGHTDPARLISRFRRALSAHSSDIVQTILAGFGEDAVTAPDVINVSPLSFAKSMVTGDADPVGSQRNDSRFKRYREAKTRFGVGPKSVAAIYRIERAKSLLRAKVSLAEVALECGYFDQSHFTTSFRQYTGLTPRQFIGR